MNNIVKKITKQAAKTAALFTPSGYQPKSGPSRPPAPPTPPPRHMGSSGIGSIRTNAQAASGMGKTVQFRRGPLEESMNFTGQPGELTVDTTTWSLRVHDGKTPGGHRAGKDSIEALLECAMVKDVKLDPFLSDAFEDYEKSKKELLLRIKMMLDGGS